MASILDDFSVGVEDLYKVDENLQSKLSSLTKWLHDFGKSKWSSFGPLESLTVEGFDDEQIWQQLELTNKPLLDEIGGSQPQAHQNAEDDSSSSSDEDRPESTEAKSIDAAEDEDEKSAEVKRDMTPSGSSEESEPEPGPREEEDTGDLGLIPQSNTAGETNELGDDGLEMMFANEPVDPAAANAKAEEFDAVASEDSEDEKKLSTFERQSRAVQARIMKLEEQNLEGRSWQLMGEASSKSRPKDALLEEFMEFDFVDKLKPEITEEVTNDLDQLIRTRIRSQAWDDVERKAEEAPKFRRKLVEVSSKKSEEGLAQIYERVYLDQAKREAGEETLEETKLTKQQEEIARLKADLFYHLDALTNFHYTPKHAKQDLEIKPNVAAIGMEEALPMGVAKSSLQAPEDVYQPPKKATLVGATEITRSERKARRREHKRRRKKQKGPSKGQDNGGEEVVKSTSSKNAQTSDAVDYNSSKVIFSILQEMQEKQKRGVKRKNDKEIDNESTKKKQRKSSNLIM